MSRKTKISHEIKIKYVEAIISGKKSISDAAREIGVDKKTVRQWIALYKAEGPSALIPNNRNKIYPTEIKLAAVQDYLSGKYSGLKLCEKYGVSNPHIIKNWSIQYTTHGTLKTRGGRTTMGARKSRKTTYEERVEIVNYCLDHEFDYGGTAEKYNVTYQNVYQWVAKYKKYGEPGLEDRKGKRLGSMPARSEEEALKIENAQLKAKNRLLEMELDLRKKVEELSREKNFR